MTKAYRYGGPGLGVYESRHEAVGGAAITMREDGSYPNAPWTHPGRASQWIMPIPTARCGYCGEAFDYEGELDDHKPCPEWEKDKPLPPEGGSNPIEAARMTRNGI